jgi:hypothetical protein
LRGDAVVLQRLTHQARLDVHAAIAGQLGHRGTIARR